MKLQTGRVNDVSDAAEVEPPRLTPTSVTAWIIRIFSVYHAWLGIFGIIHQAVVAFGLPPVTMLGMSIGLPKTEYAWITFICNLGDVLAYVIAFAFSQALAFTLTGAKLLEPEPNFDLVKHGKGVFGGLVGLFMVLAALDTNLNCALSLIRAQIDFGYISHRIWGPTKLQMAHAFVTASLGLILLIWGRRYLLHSTGFGDERDADQ